MSAFYGFVEEFGTIWLANSVHMRRSGPARIRCCLGLPKSALLTKMWSLIRLVPRARPHDSEGTPTAQKHPLRQVGREFSRSHEQAQGRVSKQLVVGSKSTKYLRGVSGGSDGVDDDGNVVWCCRASPAISNG